MDENTFSRQRRYVDIASSLANASHLYKKAADAMLAGEDEKIYYAWVKEANLLVDDAFPEKVAPKYIPEPPTTKGFDWKTLAQILIPVIAILGTLLFLVFSGTTGDLTKTWNLEDIQKNSLYPKQAPTN